MSGQERVYSAGEPPTSEDMRRANPAIPDRVNLPDDADRAPVCHPRRKHVADGLCGSCVLAVRRAVERGEGWAEAREAQIAWQERARQKRHRLVEPPLDMGWLR